MGPVSSGTGSSERLAVTRLLTACPDRPGIVAAVSEFLSARGANIASSSQYSTDPDGGEFLMRIEFQLPRGRLQSRQSFGGFGRSTLGRREGRIEETLGALASAFQPAGGAGEGGLRAGIPIKLADRLAQSLGQSFGALQQTPPSGEAVLFVGLGRQRIEFGQMMPQ